MPEAEASANAWIVSRRGTRNSVDPWKPYHYLVEREPDGNGHVATVATIFLTNRECPWRCVMCDLWKNTLTETVPAGAIPAQIDYALEQMSAEIEGVSENRSPHHIKLYNSGSFFDPRAIPPEDYDQIADRCLPFRRVIVECHPSLVKPRANRFLAMLQDRGIGALEVAMGLETAHPGVLAKLNKRMTLDQLADAAAYLRSNQIDWRAFILVKPPYLTNEAEALDWARRSVDFAFDHEASVVSLIPTRFGNGALESLAESGEFAPPKLGSLEEAFDYALKLGRGRVFVDLWDLEKFSECSSCYPARKRRLRDMNLTQEVLPRITCPLCSPPSQP